MADYSGVISSNITINDGDTIGAASNPYFVSPYVVDFTAGAEVLMYTRSIYLRTEVNIVGTLANPILLSPQSATPYSGVSGQFVIDNVTADLTVEYVKADCMSNFLSCGAYAGSSVYINKLWCESIDRVLYITGTLVSCGWTIQNVYINKCETTFIDWRSGGADAVTLQTIWCENGARVCNLDSTDLTLDRLVMQNSNTYSYFYPNSNIAFTQNYYTNFPSQTHYVSTAGVAIDFSDSIIYKTIGNGIQVNSATSQIDSSYCDYIDIILYGTAKSAGTLNSDYDCYSGCKEYQIGFIDTVGGVQAYNIDSQTNIQSALNHPLEVDNISEGSPSGGAITITYDCKASTATSKRLYGLPFIKYGTTSGIYTEQSYLPPKEEWGLYWIGWYTDNAFAQTGHSVTLNNLKAGTKYYYKCCFVDPLGRLAESAEGDFTTTAGGGHPFPPFFH